ncbi:MAG: phosphotransferase family protein [Haloechinothrix sp.]
MAELLLLPDPDLASAPERVLERGLARHLGRPVRIVDAVRKPLGTFSSHPISRLSVHLDDGEQLPVIFKRLRSEAGKDVRREVLLYERLLAGGRFGAPVLYASLCDDAAGRYWLFLEDVGNRRLDWCDAHDWEPAFRWLARMHAACHGQAEQLSRLGCLSDHGPGFYRALAGAARRSLEAYGEPGALLRFDGLMQRWLSRSVAYLDHQPRTLVHGDFSCHNVMVARDGRVRPIDWEWAAIGVAAWDVAKLLAGWGARRPRFLAAYADEFGRHTGERLDRDEFAAAVAHARVMHKLWYLRWWIEPCRDPVFVDRLLGKMEHTWRLLDDGASR